MIQLFVKQVNHNDNAGKDTSRIFSNNSIFFFSIADPTTKKYGLLICGGEDIADVKKAPLDPPPKAGSDVYKVLIQKINKHFMPKQDKGFTRFRLSKL